MSDSNISPTDQDLNSNSNKEKFARKCDKCGKVFNEGFCVGGGDEYYCSDKCLYSEYTKDEWEEMYNDADSDSYWTCWEDESEFQYYADGSEVEE